MWISVQYRLPIRKTNGDKDFRRSLISNFLSCYSPRLKFLSFGLQCRSFSFNLKTPPVADLLRRALSVEKGSGVPNLEKIGTLPREKLQEIARLKMKDLNAADMDGALRMIEGTARSMGIEEE